MRSEAQEWAFRMMNDPDQFERWRYIDTLHDYRTIIAEMEKAYVQTPVTQRYIRARIQSELHEAKKALAKTMAEYNDFKKYKARTSISR